MPHLITSTTPFGRLPNDHEFINTSPKFNHLDVARNALPTQYIAADLGHLIGCGVASVTRERSTTVPSAHKIMDSDLKA